MYKNNNKKIKYVYSNRYLKMEKKNHVNGWNRVMIQKKLDMRYMWLRWNQLRNSNLRSVTHVYKPLWRRSVLKCFVGILFAHFDIRTGCLLKKSYLNVFFLWLKLIKIFQFFKDKPAFMNIYAHIYAEMNCLLPKWCFRKLGRLLW